MAVVAPRPDVNVLGWSGNPVDNLLRAPAVVPNPLRPRLGRASCDCTATRDDGLRGAPEEGLARLEIAGKLIAFAEGVADAGVPASGFGKTDVLTNGVVVVVVVVGWSRVGWADIVMRLGSIGVRPVCTGHKAGVGADDEWTECGACGGLVRSPPWLGPGGGYRPAPGGGCPYPCGCGG